MKLFSGLKQDWTRDCWGVYIYVGINLIRSLSYSLSSQFFNTHATQILMTLQRKCVNQQRKIEDEEFHDDE